MNLPNHDGRYLVLAYEWVGTAKDKPLEPSWDVRSFVDGMFARTRYYFDTGGYENFEVVRWQRLPPIK